MSTETQLSAPAHVGIIMDGNRRWAKLQGKPAWFGHLAGVNNLEPLIRHAQTRGVRAFTIYAFSTENWQRSADEVGYLFKLFKTFATTKLKMLTASGVHVQLLGQVDRLPEDVRQALAELVTKTAANTAFTLSLCISYGGRDEIVRAIHRAHAAGQIEGLTEEAFRRYLDQPEQPDPELIIRTSGEQRLSNFLVWQAAYSELYFTEIPWPAFTPDDLDQALAWYAGRGRRFGK